MYSQEKRYSDLAKILSTFDYVYIDTCSAMSCGFPEFMDDVVGSKKYWRQGLKIIIPGECIDELKKHASSTDRRETNTRIDAQRALHIIRDAKWRHGALHIGRKQKQNEEKKDTTFADPIFCANAMRLRIHYRLLFITEDGNLKKDLLSINALSSQMGKDLSVMNITKTGELEGKIYLSNSHHKEKMTLNLASKAPNKLSSDFMKSVQKPTKTVEKPTQKPLPSPAVKTNQPAPKAAPTPAPKAAPVVAKPAPGKVAAPAPESKKAEAPVAPKAPKSWYENGNTIQDALSRCCSHFGIIVRDPSAPYTEKVHGPIDVTTVDLIKLIQEGDFQEVGSKHNYALRNLVFTAEKLERGFRVTMLPPQPLEKEAAPKPTPEPKKPEVKAEEKKPEPQEKPETNEPKSAKKRATKKKAEEPKAEEAPVKAEEEPKAPAKKAKSSKAKEKAEDNKANKPEEKPAEKPAKKAAPKKTNLQKAQDLEKRLSANVSNPNYPTEKKLKDIEAFQKAVAKLTDEEKKQIKLTAEFLDEKKKALAA